MPKPIPQASNKNTGLDSTYSFGLSTLASKVRYIEAEGYFYGPDPNYQPASYTFQVDDLAGSTTMLVMGTVTVLNPRSFTKTMVGVSRTVGVFLPSANTYAKVIVKSARSDPDQTFSFSTLGAAFPKWDMWQWGATYADACAVKLITC
eukprot:gene9850-7737_t